MAEIIRHQQSLQVKNLRHFSRDNRRERRYPFLVAIDLLLHFGLILAAIVLTAIALMMAFQAIWARFFG